MTSSSQHLSWVKLCSSCVCLIILLLSAFDVLSTVYQLFIQLFINCFSTFYQLSSTFHQHVINFYQLSIDFINFLSTFYQRFINFLSTFYQLFLSFLSTVYQLFINCLSTFFINLEEMITFDKCETLFALLPGHTMFLVGQSLSILFPGVLVSPPTHFWTRCSWSTSITAIV